MVLADQEVRFAVPDVEAAIAALQRDGELSVQIKPVTSSPLRITYP